MSFLQHEVESKLPGKLNKPVISGFGDDEDGLDDGVDASSTCIHEADQL